MDNIENFGVYISTYGCQMNVNDTERMYSLLEMMNYSEVKEPKEADLIIINSCSVREKPVHKVHSEVGRYKKLKERNPELRIGVSGCVAQQEKAKLLTDIPMLDFVVGTDNIDALPQIVKDLQQKKSKQNVTDFKHREAYHIETLVRNPGVSTFINITKGCDNFCTFCVVPYTRGRERSRPLKMVIQDINELTKKGVKETTLLGQNVNSYESDCGADFAKLLERVCLETDISRVRYTTSHPKDFNQELVDVMKRHSDKLGAYVHLPVQSGNSEVLKNMNRGYTREDYLERIKMIRQALPDVSFSTDIIVGFPGETEAQFEDTASLLSEVGYETIFAFKYSPRPFTKAARFENQVAEVDKSRRLNELFRRHKLVAEKIAERYLGRTLEILVEEHNSQNDTVSGRSPHNKLVHFKGSKDLVGQLVNVVVTEAFPHNLRGGLLQ